jgi:tetratricopeptide (TPR) repeat protein
MAKPEFPVPPSLVAYVRLYDESPDKAIAKMEAAYQKRRSDPVLLAWLSWMWLEQGQQADALRYANLAMVQAPGSPVIAQLRYLCIHPDGFAALSPTWSVATASTASMSTDFGVPFDLDSLITKLSHAGKRKITLSESTEPNVDMAKESAKRGKIATHTLAIVHEKQGRYQEALDVYKQLLAAKPERESVYAEHIARISAKLAGTD